MAKKSKSGIHNADTIIEKFGGIRPMAKKMGVAVTTIQGWKKRDKIPASRRAQLLKTAEQNNIDISSLINGAKTPKPRIATDNIEKIEEIVVVNDDAETLEGMDIGDDETSVEGNDGSEDEGEPLQKPESLDTAYTNKYADLDARLIKTEQKAVTKSIWITVVLILLAIALMMFILFPKINKNDALVMQKQRIETIEQDVQELQEGVDDLQNRQSFFRTIVPENLDERINDIQQKAQSAQENVQSAIQLFETKTSQIGNDVFSDTAGSLEQRLEKLESHISDIKAAPEISMFLNRLDALKQNVTGQAAIDQSISELNDIVENAPSTKDIHLIPAFESVRERSAAVRETMGNVPKDDLKAAALLMTMTQLRSSLNRNNKPFEDDLNLLLNLTGDENTPLKDSIQKLAPKAEEGVLSPQGLSNEFKGVMGDALAASLSGEDVSVKEKMKARFSKLMAVEKDGELINGTETQATLTRTQTLLDNQDISGALSEVQNLPPSSLQALKPWMSKAQTTLDAQNVSNMIDSKLRALKIPVSVSSAIKNLP